MNNTVKHLTAILGAALAAALLTAVTALAQHPQQLGKSHAHQRVSVSHRYLLLPVQDREDLATIVVLSDNRQVQSLNVRLAGDEMWIYSSDNLVDWTFESSFGKDHYATVTFDNAPDGRKIALAWMSNWQYANQVPTKQFRSANSVPRDLDLFEWGGEIYCGVTPSRELNAILFFQVLPGALRLTAN